MNIAIHQPDYFPYLPSFYLIYLVSDYIFLDDAQYTTSGMNNYNRIKTPQGECRIKIPVEYHLGDAINEVRTKDELGWRYKHVKIIEMNYKKASYFNDYFPLLRDLICSDYTSLAERNIDICVQIANRFGIGCKFHKSSELEIYSKKEERVIEICQFFNKKTYISGHGSRAYINKDNFDSAGLKLEYNCYQAFEYPQQWGCFLPNLSIIDYILNCGFDWDRVMKGQMEYTNNHK